MSESNDIFYEKFLTSQQAAVRLEMALRGFLVPEGFTQEQHRAFEAYLKERIRPAVQRLIERDEWEKLSVLEEQGWLSSAVIEEGLSVAIAQKKTAAFLWLLQQKAEKYGFHDRDLEL